MVYRCWFTMLFIFHRQDSSYAWSLTKAPMIWLAYKSQFSEKYNGSQVSCMLMYIETNKSNNSHKNQLTGWLNIFFLTVSWNDVETITELESEHALVKVLRCPSQWFHFSFHDSLSIFLSPSTFFVHCLHCTSPVIRGSWIILGGLVIWVLLCPHSN